MNINVAINLSTHEGTKTFQRLTPVGDEVAIMMAYIRRLPFYNDYLLSKPHQFINLCHILAECQRCQYMSSNIINKKPLQPLVSPGFLMLTKDMSREIFGERQVQWIFGAVIKANLAYRYVDAQFTVKFDSFNKDRLVWVAFHNRDGGMPVLTSASSATMKTLPDDAPTDFRHQVHEFVSSLYGLPKGSGL